MVILFQVCYSINISFDYYFLGNFFPSQRQNNNCNSRNCVKFPENDIVDYAIGAPNVMNNRGIVSGVVYLCPNCFRESRDTISFHTGGFELTLNGFQFGERFGHAVISIDIDGDNYDDIVVGAPLHSTDKVILNVLSFS